VSVAYSIKNGSAVTCRIFDGQYGPPRDDPEAIKKEMVEIASGIAAVWQRMGASVELALPIGPLPSDKKQFVMVHRITHPKGSSVSITLFRFYEGRYLSFRFTTPELDTTAAFNEMGRFLVALRASKKDKELNRTSEPMSGSVTPPAGAGAAPEAPDSKTSELSPSVSSAITEDDIQAYYTANAHEFFQKEQIRLKVFQVSRGAGESDSALLQRFRRELERLRTAERKAGQVAKPDDPFMQDWGWRDREALKKPVADLLFALEAGTITDPLVTPEGCFIFRVEGRKEAGLQPLSEVRTVIIQKLQRKRAGPIVFPKDMPRF
jgi:hypothetical protein